MGVSTNLGTNVKRRKMTNSVNVDVTVNVRAKRGDEGNGVSFEIGDAWEKAKEVSFYVLFLWDPVLFSVVIDNSVLMGVAVDDVGTGGGMEEIGEEVGYWCFWEYGCFR